MKQMRNSSRTETSPANHLRRSVARWIIAIPVLIWTPTVYFPAAADATLPAPVDAVATDYTPNPLKSFLQSLDYNRDEARSIVERNRDDIQLAARAFNVPDWMIASIIYVETAQGIPGAWRLNDSASRDLFIGFGRKTSMGVMQVQQDPDKLGLEDHWQRMNYARTYQANETMQILDGARHLQAALTQSNRLAGHNPNDYRWTTHKLAVIAHEYNTGPINWRNTTWEEAQPLDYGDLFTKFLPDAYHALHGNDLTEWPLLYIPEELQQFMAITAAQESAEAEKELLQNP